MNRKQRVVVLFGGRSAEHEVSCTSAVWVLQSLDQNKYDVTAVGVTKEGHWVVSDSAARLLEATASQEIHGFTTVLAAGVEVDQAAVLALDRDGVSAGGAGDLDQIRSSELPPSELPPVVIPVIHGPYGEDGTVQGLLELAGVPFVGSGVLASAIAMDKLVAKTMFASAGLPQAKFCGRAAWQLSSDEDMRAFEFECVEQFGYPMFVKPANLGSSVGVSKVSSPDEFGSAVTIAVGFDDWVIVEEAINGREIEFAVLGNESPQVSVGGEILPSTEFYDYDDKYVLGASQTQIPADLSEADLARGQQLALQAYATLRCEGLSRVDFFFDDGSTRPDGRTPRGWLINEINTIPGCTPISMYPKLWEASGIPGPELLDRLVEHALDRFARRSGRVGRSR